MTPLLEVERLGKAFGGLTVTDQVSLRLDAGERTALIGPNGAGKTTFVNLVSGLVKPSTGAIRLAGREVTRTPAMARVRMGLVRTFQIARLWRSMSVADHVELALMRRHRLTSRLFADPDMFAALKDEAIAVLDGLGLAGLRDRPATEISYGQQRLLEIAIALALRPKVLILDEPAAGVPDADTRHILAAIEALPADMAVLMIDHDMDLVFRFARRILVLVNGRLVCDGVPDAVADDPQVRAAYLGSYGHGRAA